jgi:hypothetical protein
VIGVRVQVPPFPFDFFLVILIEMLVGDYTFGKYLCIIVVRVNRFSKKLRIISKILYV